VAERSSLGEWLELREPADAAARSSDVTDALARWLPPGRPIRAIDLGAGAGSNIRYLTARLGRPTRWLAVDRDPLLLSNIHDAEIRQRELGHLDAELFRNSDLVSASALLDLTSAAWIEGLAACCRSVDACVLFALTYDGRSECFPAEPEDGFVRNLFNRHQRSSDHGFGAAAGPDAADVAARALAGAGYKIRLAKSDWSLSPDVRRLQQLLIEGWAQAAAEIATAEGSTIDDWRRRRLQHVHAGESRIVVGHVDIAGWIVK
jgi:hypothetical protein